MPAIVTTSNPWARIPPVGLLLGLLLGLPLLGVWLAGQPLADYLEFPPLTRHVEHADFSWPVFILLAALLLAVALPFDDRVMRRRKQLPRTPPARAFPWWGWLGLALGLAAWVLAWTRWAWVQPWQRHTFTPLWLSYILVVNALAWRRTGRCMIRDRPRFFLLLFPVSAAFWWFFEFLNRFVQNWYYTGISAMTPLQYFFFATLPFATVLPAVLGTCEWLTAHPASTAGLGRFVVVRSPRRARLVALAMLILAGAGLLGIGVRPDIMFPLLWLAPLILLTALRTLQGRPTIFADLARGDWRRLYALAMAGLLCGFFWEMWNYGSLARWIYDVPYVGRFKLFEMPVLGYAGYLPFGWECAVVGDGLAEWLDERNPATEPS
ncbi:MAG: hypothetical protein NTV49_01675 [Kiritimatiellaeota bacterium]|nr:hypothetical protein [Kiritimatiellota bacterium]